MAVAKKKTSSEKEHGAIFTEPLPLRDLPQINFHWLQKRKRRKVEKS